ncbi:hypothetical protein ACJJTC_017260 [Scirpophaga incertulas]
MHIDSKSYSLVSKFILAFLFAALYTIGSKIILYGITFSFIPPICSWVSIICKVSNDFVRLTNVFVFSCSCWRIKNFVTVVKKDNIDIVSCQYLYKNIVDITEKIKGNFNVVVSFIFYLHLMLDVLKNLSIMFAPAFTAGMLSAQVEDLVLALRDKLLLTKDNKQSRDIRRFINYVEARPMKFKVYNVIPLDWNLLIIVINITVTYLIVLIQFHQG